jgi:DNA (cytosine-5)-methyltransferase 1
MFKGLRVLRHRLFEANFLIASLAHRKHPICHTFDKRKAQYGKTNEMRDFVSVNGGGNSSVAAASDAMGIDWMTKNELNEAIPPAYTEFIGRQLLFHLVGKEREQATKNSPAARRKPSKNPTRTEASVGAPIATGR